MKQVHTKSLNSNIECIDIKQSSTSILCTKLNNFINLIGLFSPIKNYFMMKPSKMKVCHFCLDSTIGLFLDSR